MKKKVLIPAILAVVALVAVLIVVNPLGGNGIVPDGGNSTPDNGTNSTPPQNTNSISPGKVFIDNYVAGASAPYQIQIHNANNISATFSVDYRVPDWVGENYSRPTSEVRDWVWISNRRPVIPAHTTYTVDISLGMPSTATPPGDKWEFWIGVIDQSQTGNIHIELCQRWLITMG